jgi:protein-tyrosine phosphatase
VDWITEQIAIGNYLDALDVELLRNSGIASALSLDGTLHGKNPAEFGLRRIETVMLEDAPGNDPRLFRRAVEHLTDLVSEASPVLVQCHAGRSRSAVVVAGYLVKSEGMESEDALALVAAKREIAITAGVERLLEHL